MNTPGSTQRTTERAPDARHTKAAPAYAAAATTTKPAATPSSEAGASVALTGDGQIVEAGYGHGV